MKSSSVPLNIDSPLPLTKTHVPCKRLGCIQIAKGLLAALVVGAVLTGCGGSSSSSSSAPPQYKVSAALSNVATSGLKLHLDASGEFRNIDVRNRCRPSISLSSLSEGRTYAVSVIQHPEGQHCSIQNARGTMSGEFDVSNIAVTCETLQPTSSAQRWLIWWDLACSCSLPAPMLESTGALKRFPSRRMATLNRRLFFPPLAQRQYL